MAESTFGKYILKATKEKNSFAETAAVKPVELDGLKDWGGIQHRLKWAYISQPNLMVDTPHSHDCDEFICFFGCDPTNKSDFGAEVELCLGTEREKQVINAPTIVCIPKGLVHCPLNFVKITKPIMFCRIYNTPQYPRKPEP
ncbi:MAG: hypothetical protein JXA46_10115 [Dehalococcoidales bacterium]|nr:hypothetical protein [Dehalococcoidales bacterium]